MKVYRFLSMLLLVIVFTGCSDDTPPVPSDVIEETDDFLGDARTFQLGAETSGLTSVEVTCKILSPDGQIISRHGTHSRSGGVSNFVLGNGLKDGTYRLLYVEYPIEDNSELASLADRFKTAQYGLGCRIAVAGGAITVCDEFDDDINLVGSGSQDDPYIISSYAHLITLMKYVNSDETNKKITSSTYFKQTNPIDMEQASCECDLRYGWLPIGADTNTPFRGVYQGDELSYLWIDRPTSSGIGLFGYLYNATIDGLKMSHADVTGNFAVGAVAGATISAGDERGKSVFTNCSLADCEVSGSTQSFAIGGLVGAVDMYAGTLVQKCVSSGGSVSGSYNVGGLVGGCGMYSNLTLGDCSNGASITGEYSGAGGIVGVADTLVAVGCKNDAMVRGATKYSSGDTSNGCIGAGGIVGGSGISWLTSCVNGGDVSGVNGVGGIIGSTRIIGDNSSASVFNNTYVRWSQNTGNVSGEMFVGGICGEAQFGCYGVYNSGGISGGDYTAGVVGNTSIAVAHNAVNTGSVSGGSYCSGIVGKTTWGAIALDHNYGTVTGSGSHTAGILGLGGNNTIINYCGNFGPINGSSSGIAGGIVAEIGDPREWTAMNITECVVGSLEIVMAFAGPCIAVAEHAVEEASKAAAIVLKVVEVSLDFALTDIVDASLWAFGLYEILAPEEVDEMTASLSGVSEEICGDVKAAMDGARRSFTGFEVRDFSQETFTSFYNDNISSNLGYYEQEGNDEIFNENINKRREERMEDLEHISKMKEIKHEIIAGVSIALSTVAMIVGAVASGGAAVPFMFVGSMSAIVGGVNAITKSVTDFAENAVVISQCVNAGVVSNGKAGGIVGIIQDQGLIENCLNTGENARPFVYQAKSKAEIESCLSVCYAGMKDYENADHYENVGYYKSGSSYSEDTKWDYFYHQGILYMTADDLNNADHYCQNGSIDILNNNQVNTIGMEFKLDVGDRGAWNLRNLSSGKTFAVPNYSEMRQ